MQKYIFLFILILAAILWQTNTFSTDNAGSQQFNKQQYSLSDPTSPWIVVNKSRPLTPKNYAPADLRLVNVELRQPKGSQEMKLRSVAAKALEQMFAIAKSNGYKLALASGYRSYDLQQVTYQSELEGFGKQYADRVSAHPGYSEHQTGLAADVGPASGRCVVLTCFAKTAEGKWLAENAWKYGFIIRYVKSGEEITGYKYEPWHIRFVGKELAAQIKHSGKTLEEFFSLPAAPDYL